LGISKDHCLLWGSETPGYVTSYSVSKKVWIMTCNTDEFAINPHVFIALFLSLSLV